MKIGGFEVGSWTVKEEGASRHLIFDCRDCVYGSSIADDRACMFHAIKVLEEVEVDDIVLAEVYERVYSKEQTRLLNGISQVAQKFAVETIWSYNHLGDPKVEGEKYFGERHNTIVRITHDNIFFDPIASYIELLQAIKAERERMQAEDPKSYSGVFLKTLSYIKKTLEETELISRSRDVLLNLKTVPPTQELHRSFFEAAVKPSFIGSKLIFESADERLELLDEYQVKDVSVQIFRHPTKTQKLYFINPPEYSLPPDKYFILSKTREVVASYRPGKTSLSSIAKSRKYFERVYQSTIRDISKQNKIELSNEEIIELSEIVARYTVGYGILEILLSDRRITDIYLDAPIGLKPIYLVHSEFGDCETNIVYTEGEANAMVSKLRAMSGRPFDEAHPVLDYNLPDMDARLALIGPPLSSDGIAFAFRLHKVTPWTLPQFIDNNFISPLGAGLLSFFVDSQATMLVTGSRGSGKTSLTQSLMLEITQNSRIIVQEDSVAGDSQILIERNGEMESSTVGEIIDSAIEKFGSHNDGGREILLANPENVHVFAMDKQGKISLSRVSQFMRHRSGKEIFEVTTRAGRKIKVTGDHGLFGLKNNEIVPVKCRDLKKGSFIAVPGEISFERNAKGFISVLDNPGWIEKGFITGPKIGQFTEKNWLKIKELAKSMGYSKSIPSAWKRNCVLPVKIFKELDFSQLSELDLKFKVDKKSKPIPVVIGLDENFLTFIGLWLADGSFDGKYGVIISSPGCEVVVLQTANQLGLKPRNHSDGFSTIISNTSFVFVLKQIFGLQGNAYTKSFPQWVFSLSKKQLSCVLKGLFSGDGFTAKYEVGISLVSKKLVQETEFLLSLFGIVVRKHFIERDKTLACRISSVKMVKKFREFIGFIQPYKMSNLEKICLRQPTHDNADIIPFSIEDKSVLAQTISGFNRHDYITRNYSIGREKFSGYLQSQQNPDIELFKKFSTILNSDVYWDEITAIKNLGKTNEFVYDFSVPVKESFVCENMIAHNTQEIPVPYMKEIGFNIQRLKTRSPISVSATSTEVAPEEALRTALRLGDSALIIGEVRSTEARVLYEAMRVGAAGNIVMGTIHGDSAYSVWDRIVNDLDVPNTSFKATDLVVVARPIRFLGSLEKARRVVQVTEVKKHWTEDPEQEGGFLDLMTYNAKKDRLELLEDNLKESAIFSKISGITGLSIGKIWENIKMVSSSKEFLVEMKNEFKVPELLEAENSVIAHNKLLLLKQKSLEENGAVDYTGVLGEWKNWVKDQFVKRILARKKF